MAFPPIRLAARVASRYSSLRGSSQPRAMLPDGGAMSGAVPNAGLRLGGRGVERLGS